MSWGTTFNSLWERADEKAKAAVSAVATGAAKVGKVALKGLELVGRTAVKGLEFVGKVTVKGLELTGRAAFFLAGKVRDAYDAVNHVFSDSEIAQICPGCLLAKLGLEWAREKWTGRPEAMPDPKDLPRLPADKSDDAPIRIDAAPQFKHAKMQKDMAEVPSGAGDPKLRKAMEAIQAGPSDEELPRVLQTIADATGRPLEKVKKDYRKYLKLREQAEATKVSKGGEDIPRLSERHAAHMASTPQLRFGKVVGDSFGIDPVFGALLSPTGGIVGPGNFELYNADPNDPVVKHGCVHDAAGYLYNYHDAGPGYQYAPDVEHTMERQKDGSMKPSTANPLNGQVSGIEYWLGLGSTGASSETTDSLKK